VAGSGSGRDEGIFNRVFAPPRSGHALPLSPALIACFLVVSIIRVAAAAELEPQFALAAEVEQQRSACAAAGEEILADNAIGSAAYQDQFSRYSPRTNRCFVEMLVQTLTADERSDRTGRFLYDGQTKELLAFVQIRDGKKSGRVFDLNHATRTFENSGWDDASEYIYTMMIGDGGA
jgi:hypothetical protein